MHSVIMYMFVTVTVFDIKGPKRGDFQIVNLFIFHPILMEIFDKMIIVMG
jgi:hypothetical protein